MSRLWRRWSIRTRLMVIGLLGLATAQAIGSVALAAALHVAAERRVERSAQATASEVESLILAGHLPSTLPVAGAEIVQVLDDQRRVVSASQNADRLTALLHGDEIDRAQRGRLEVSGSRVALDSDLQVWATPVQVAGTRFTVIVAEPTENLVTSDALLRRVLVISFPLLLLGLGLIAWRVIGAAMRPVEELRSAADQISGSGRGDRLPVPPSDDEIHALAVTLNSMLDRLDQARERETGFVADAAHELRSPLASMRMQVDVARRLGDGGTLVEELSQDVDRLEALVDDLLALARLDAASTSLSPVVAEPLSVRPELERVAAVWRRAGTEVEVRPGAEMTVAVGAGELERILGNLVGNAARLSGQVRLAALRRGGRVLISVEDDGPGIAVADRERVFERFTRLDEARDRDIGGAGLGLPIVRGLARARGGDVTLHESASGGLRAEVELPVWPDEPM